MDGGSESRLRKDGAFHFPVFHRKHPCVDDNSSTIIHAASVSDAGTVIGNDKIHQGKYLMAISLGTPAVFNLVAIDTGSTLSWVNCERCLIRCHEQAGPKLDPHRSATYRHVVGCSDEDCLDVQGDNGVPYGCVDDDETDTCLYGLRYGSQYSVGKLGRDRLALGDNYTAPSSTASSSGAARTTGSTASRLASSASATSATPSSTRWPG